MMAHQYFAPCGCQIQITYGSWPLSGITGVVVAAPCAKHGGGRYEAGDAPHAPGSDTSQEAARLIAGRTNKICEELLYWFSIRPGGLTVEEAAEVSKIPRRTVAPRLTALQGAGLIHDSGERRKLSTGRRAVVWKLSPKGGQHVP